MTDLTDNQPRKKFFIIHNPNSGNSKHKLLNKSCKLLKKAGAEITIKQTSCFGEGAKVAQQAVESELYDAIIAVGGDGTIQDVAMGMLGSTVPLGLIPTGTGNVLARELNYKFTAPFIANTLLNTLDRPVHVGLVNDLPFLFAASVGYDAHVVKEFEKSNGRRLGRAGYAMPGMRAMFNDQGSTLKVTMNNETHEAEWVIVTRVRFYASDFLLRPEADIANNLLHVVLFTGKGKLLRIRQLIGLATNRLPKMSSVSFHTTETVKIEGDPKNIVQVDGEPTETLPLNFKIHPKRLQVISSLSKQ